MKSRKRRFGDDGIGLADRTHHFQAMTGRTYSGQLLWTVDEIATVRRLHPDYPAIHAALPHRTLASIRLKAQKLGIPKKRKRFADYEIAALWRLYPKGSWEEIEAALPGRTRRCIRVAAWRRGISRAKPDIYPSEFPLVNRILRLCREFRLTLRDLEEMTGASGYFYAGKFRTRFKAEPIRAALALFSSNFSNKPLLTDELTATSRRSTATGHGAQERA